MHNASLYYHMVFPANLISSMIVGFISCFHLVLLGIAVFYGLAHELFNVRDSILLLLSLFVFSIIFTWIQRFIIRYYLADSKMSKLQINIKHLRLFFVLKFFLLFANIISSITSLLKRLVFIILNFLIFYESIETHSCFLSLWIS